jgi:hypothetical protein
MKVSLAKISEPLSIHIVWGMIIIFVLAISRYLPALGCPFHNLTGLPCLSCGSSRAADALWRGDFIQMFYFNPLMVTFCAGLLFFSLLKLLEYIFRLKLNIEFGRKEVVFARYFLVFTIAGNWLFLVVNKR